MVSPHSYQFVVQGHLDQDWSNWFEGMTLTYDEKGNTILTGLLEDQSALHGVLHKIRDRGLTLLALTCVEQDKPHG